MILPETVGREAARRARPRRRRAHRRQGPRPDGEPLGNFEPGADIVAKVTVLAEGTQGHLTGVALDHFGLRGDEPQVWELGVKEVWKVAEAARPRSSTRWAGRCASAREVPRVRRLVHLPDGRRHAHDRHGRRARLPRRRAVRARPAAGAEDAPEDPQAARGRRARRVGREDDPERRLPLAAAAAARARPAHVRRRRRHRQHPARSRASTTRSSRDGSRPSRRSRRCSAARRRRRALASLRRRDPRTSFIWQRPARGARHAPGVRPRLLRRRRARERDDGVEGTLAPGRCAPSPTRSSRCCAPTARRAIRRPTASSPSTSSRRSSLSGNKTRDDQPNHIRIERRVPREVAEMWVHMCPAQVYEVGTEGGDGTVTVQLAPSNCVQCGAITAKGGRLTPPEGGSGPEYTHVTLPPFYARRTAPDRTGGWSVDRVVAHTEVNRCAPSLPRHAQSAALAAAGAAFAGNGHGNGHGPRLPLLVPRPADRDARERRRLDHRRRAATVPRCARCSAQPVTQTFAYGTDDRVPQVVERHPDRRPARRPRRRRLRLGATSARRAVRARRDRAEGGRHRRRPRHAALQADKPLYLFRGTLTSVGSISVTVHVTGGNRRALRLLIGQSADQTFTFGGEHDLPALAGQGPDRDRRVEARRRRQDRRPRSAPRRASTLAQVESTAGEPRRRPRAGRQVVMRTAFRVRAVLRTARSVLQRPYASIRAER